MQSKNISVLDIPFNKLIRLKESDREEYLFKINYHPDLMNHLDTFHAGLLFSLAESTGGQFLLNEYDNPDAEIIPVIRKAEIKYNRPGRLAAYSRAEIVTPTMDEVRDILSTKKRVLIKVKTEVFNEKDVRLLSAVFDWFVTTF